MTNLLDRVTDIDWALAIAILVAALVAVPSGRRGGRYRTLPGWAGSWFLLGVVLLALSHAPRAISLVMLGLVMFATLRGYFFVAPVRTRDRYAVLAAYLAVPFALYTAYVGSHDFFLATVPVTLFLLVPVFLALGKQQVGMLDSMGRALLGVVFFVFCTAHLALLSDVRPEAFGNFEPRGLPQLFGVLVLSAELPRRMSGGFGSKSGWVRPVSGIVFGILLAAGIGFWLGPRCGLVEEDAARAGFLVGCAVNLGASVSKAVAKDLELSMSTILGRGALLDRLVPAVYAAPVFFHYLNHFA
jgi:predicted CDP-diglyceride synthetase/phosphatidate cytidylyltransferase